MSKEIQVRKWVFSDPKKNSNKFWNVHVYDNGTWKAHYGRVGQVGNWVGPKPMHELAAKIREKEEKKGYKEIVQAKDGEEHTIPTPVGNIALSQIKEAFKISERILELKYDDREAQNLYPRYMQIMPIDIGLNSQPWNIYHHIKAKHGKLKEIIEAADNNSSNEFFISLLDHFFSEMNE